MNFFCEVMNMKHEWDYFLEDIKKQKNENMISVEQADALSNSLFYNFRKYRHSSAELRESMDCLLKLHTEVCRERPGDELLKRRHNALVYKYVINIIASDKAIAKKMGVSEESLYLDLEKVKREMCIICIGIVYLIPEGEENSLITRILENYQLLIRCMPSPNIALLFPERYHREILKYQEVTGAYLSRFHECVTLYDEFCSNDQYGIGQRRSDILHGIFIDGNKTIENIMKEYSCSRETVYKDMKKNETYLKELMLTINSCNGSPS